jgi:hypothetical protein
MTLGWSEPLLIQLANPEPLVERVASATEGASLGDLCYLFG